MLLGLYVLINLNHEYEQIKLTIYILYQEMSCEIAVLGPQKETVNIWKHLQYFDAYTKGDDVEQRFINFEYVGNSSSMYQFNDML